MQHVAIDLGGTESQVCVRAEDGQILDERKIATRGIEAYLTTGPPPMRHQSADTRLRQPVVQLSSDQQERSKKRKK
jgi:2-keto-3-deoxy-galactonokinase